MYVPLEIDHQLQQVYNLFCVIRSICYFGAMAERIGHRRSIYAKFVHLFRWKITTIKIYEPFANVTITSTCPVVSIDQQIREMDKKI